MIPGQYTNALRRSSLRGVRASACRACHVTHGTWFPLWRGNRNGDLRWYSSKLSSDPRVRELGRVIQDDYARLRDHYGWFSEPGVLEIPDPFSQSTD